MAQGAKTVFVSIGTTPNLSGALPDKQSTAKRIIREGSCRYS